MHAVTAHGNILELPAGHRAAQEDARSVVFTVGGGHIRDTVAIKISYRDAVGVRADPVRLLRLESPVALTQQYADRGVILIGYSQIGKAVTVEICYRDG